MRKFLICPGNTEYELTPLSYDEFVKLNLWTGGSDLAYAAWLRANNLHELDSFRAEVINNGIIELRDGTREFVFDPTGMRTFVPYAEVRAASFKSQEFRNNLNSQLPDPHETNTEG